MNSAFARRPIGVGIIGLSADGGWAAEAHLPALAALDGFELRALSASSKPSARAAAAKYEVPLAFGSPEELVQRDEVDLVVVTVKVPQHRYLVKTAVQAGKAVLCEWPLGNGLAEAEDLAALAKTRGVPNFVGLQARSAPPIRYLRDLIIEGYVGRVLSTTVVGSGGVWGATFSSKQSYLLDRNNGATMLTIPFGHTIDALTMVMGEFSELSATLGLRRRLVHDDATGEAAAMTAEDQVVVNGVLEDGTVASIHYRGGHSRATNFRWEISGTEGVLAVTGDSGFLEFGQVTLQGAHRDDTELKELPLPDRYETVPALAGDRTKMFYTVGHAYAQIRSDLNEGTRVIPDFAHAVHRHRMLDRIQHAATTGQRQYLPAKDNS
jgi:predicted dehydrogenase